MKNYRYLIFIFFSLVLSGCRTSGQAVSVTLVQYNVGVFDKYEGSGFEAAANVVKELQADVVSLNEVDSCAMRTGSVDQITEFADVLGGWNKFYASAMPFNGGAYGVGVVSNPKLKIVRTDKVELPRLNGRDPRAVAVVEFEDFVFASTHLDLTLESQLGQIEALNQYVDSLYAACGKPVFIGGDFNAFPDSKPIELMKETWTLLTPVTNSFPSHAPDRCIDYIFVRPNGRKVKVESTDIPVSIQTADLATASDHLPVVLKVVIE